MNYKEAFEILDIDLSNIHYNDITTEYLTKKYRKQALRYHPDKNGNTDESTEHFKKINEAYNYLKREMNYLEPDTNGYENNNNNDVTNNDSVYYDILNLFMKSIFEGKYTSIISSIINDIVLSGKKNLLKLFTDLDKETSFHIYTFLSKHKFILHLSEDILEEVRILVLQKYDNVQIYKLNPSINDLFNNNMYKLYVDNVLYLVPLWYNESSFDGSGCEILVICEPFLPNNVIIDDDNNVYIEKDFCILDELPNMIRNMTPLEFNIGNKVFNIPISEIYMKKEQYYRIKNEGISKIKNDISDVSDKADIIVKITLL